MPTSAASETSRLPVPQTSTTEHELRLNNDSLPYTATAAWQTLFERDKPVADMFHVAYLAQETAIATRPITFIFNGGPGAASAYLHMGALGPQRVGFQSEGALPTPPVTLVDNHESWLWFSDLVFVDPIGTGFSRARTDPKSDPDRPDSVSEAAKPDKPEETKFWTVDKDLQALGEFMQGFLSRQNRWLSPVYIAGESYGGFRVAKLTRKLQQDFGIGLSGAVLISPALEFSLLEGNDYNLTYWATLMPALAAAAAHHGRAKWVGASGDMEAQLNAAETFMQQTLLPCLAMGDRLPQPERQSIYQTLAEFLGLPLSLIEQHAGRIDRPVFARELLRQDRRILGLYDASVAAIDPFPDRQTYEGSDPTLDGLQRLFMGAINHHLRDTLEIDTDLSYQLLSWDVFKGWSYELKADFKQGYVGAVNDLRVGMTLNPYMQVYIAHGIYDLVTTYSASNYLVNLMKLDPQIRSNLISRRYQGGHMFYTWDTVRSQWFEHMKVFYAQA